MFSKFKLSVDEIRKARKYIEDNLTMRVKYINADIKRKTYRPELKRLIKGSPSDKQVIDGAKLQKYFFPTGADNTYKVFISYSHDDKMEAEFLASWLQNHCNLNVFLDSYVWGNADSLLLDIDKEHCLKKDGNYAYNRRNYSTSHVHAMLSMAIMDVINNTECCIFIESGHSIHLANLKNSNKAKTLSPWIYEENKMMQLLPIRPVYREVRYFSNTRQSHVSESLDPLKIAHDMNFSGFGVLKAKHLLQLYEKGESGLDELYVELLENKMICD